MSSVPQTIDGGERLLKIGEVASQTGTTLRMLHYYEELGILEPAQRTKGGFRLYHPSAVDEVRYVQYLRDLGLELSQVRSLVAARNSEEGERVACVRGAVEKELRKVKSMIFRYRKLQAEMEATLEMLCECSARECKRTPGGSFCPDCNVVLDRDDVPTTFLMASSQ